MDWLLRRFGGERAEREFATLWPKLVEPLRDEAKKSLEMALQLQKLQPNEFVPRDDPPFIRGIVDDHWQAIRAYDPKLAKAIKSYFRAADATKRAKRSYKDARGSDPPADYKEGDEGRRLRLALLYRALRLEMRVRAFLGAVETRDEVEKSRG